MSMTLWIQTLEGRNMSKDSDDHSVLYKLSEDIDKICKAKGIAELSSFFDATDLEYNMADEDSDEEPEIDPETDCAYGIDDMKWFNADAGLKALTAIRTLVETGEGLKLKGSQKEDLLEELDDCIQVLKKISPSGGKFHLAIIM